MNKIIDKNLYLILRSIFLFSNSYFCVNPTFWSFSFSDSFLIIWISFFIFGVFFELIILSISHLYNIEIKLQNKWGINL